MSTLEEATRLWKAPMHQQLDEPIENLRALCKSIDPNRKVDGVPRKKLIARIVAYAITETYRVKGIRA